MPARHLFFLALSLLLLLFIQKTQTTGTTSRLRAQVSLALGCTQSLTSARAMIEEDAKCSRTCSFIARRNPLCWSSNPCLSVGLRDCIRVSVKRCCDRRENKLRKTEYETVERAHLCTEIVLRNATSSSVGNFFSCSTIHAITSLCGVEVAREEQIGLGRVD